MPWSESWRMFLILRDDPSSQVGAALGGFDYPLSREAGIAADTFDLLVSVNRDPNKPRPKPYPRPWPDEGTKKVGRTNLTPDEAREVLATQFGKPEPEGVPQDAPKED